jgi:uncharacterized protein (TIGR00290 family)
VEKLLFSWSAGKDSALALYELLRNPAYQVQGLLTTVTEESGRSSAHGIRRSLLRRQGQAIGLPLHEVLIPAAAPNAVYEERMAAALGPWQEAGVTAVGFGDLALEDVRAYRERHLASLGLRGVFPLWQRDARLVVEALIRLGFRAITACVDTQALDARFAGRAIDAQFLAELPAGMDPCGENGEYHSFVYDGPIFRTPVPHTIGETVLREGRFACCDLLPAG